MSRRHQKLKRPANFKNVISTRYKNQIREHYGRSHHVIDRWLKEEKEESGTVPMRYEPKKKVPQRNDLQTIMLSRAW